MVRPASAPLCPTGKTHGRFQCKRGSLNGVQNPDRPPRLWVALAIVALTFLAPILAGSTALWAKAVMMVATGLLLLAAPPRKSPGFGLTAILAAIGLIS